MGLDLCYDINLGMLLHQMPAIAGGNRPDRRMLFQKGQRLTVGLKAAFHHGMKTDGALFKRHQFDGT